MRREAKVWSIVIGVAILAGWIACLVSVVIVRSGLNPLACGVFALFQFCGAFCIMVAIHEVTVAHYYPPRGGDNHADR